MESLEFYSNHFFSRLDCLYYLIQRQKLLKELKNKINFKEILCNRTITTLYWLSGLWLNEKLFVVKFDCWKNNQINRRMSRYRKDYGDEKNTAVDEVEGRKSLLLFIWHRKRRFWKISFVDKIVLCFDVWPFAIV